MSRSTIYKMFTNPFYAGLIPYQIGGRRNSKEEVTLRPGKHRAMVSLEEFDRVQFILGRKGSPRRSRHEYAYTGSIQCGKCGGFISATHKQKLLRSTNELREYVLYYCTRARKHDGRCSQSMYTRVQIIEEEVERRLMAVELMPEFKDWALEVLAEQQEDKADTATAVAVARQNALEDAKKRLGRLTDLRLQDLVDDEEFNLKRTELKNEIARFEIQAKEANETVNDWIDLTADAFEFSTYAHKAFLRGDAKTRREILEAIGLNRRLYDGAFRFEAVEWLVPIEESYPSLQAKIRAFEPEKYGTDEWRKAAFATFRPQVRGRRDLNSQPPA